MAIPKNGEPDLVEIGGTGLQHNAGQINEEIIKQLEWPKCIKVYKEMSETDALIKGALFAIQQFIKSAKWTVEEYDGPDKPADAEYQRRFIEECFEDLDKPWEEVLTDILSFLTYGFSIHEMVFKKRGGLKTKDKRFRSKYNDGLWAFRKFPIRSQDTIEDWDIARQGELKAVRQVDTWNGIDVWIPESKFLLFRTTAYKDNPMGESLLKAAYISYANRRNLAVYEGIGAERSLAGLPIARIPAEYMSKDATPSQRALYDQMKTTVANIKANSQAGVVLPSNLYGSDDAGNGKEKFSFELLSSNTNGNTDIGPIIERYDVRILQSLCADWLKIGTQSVGSYSLASSKMAAFTTAITSYLDTIANQINQKAIPTLFEANGWDSSKTPKLVHDGVENVDMEAVGKFLADAAKGGYVTPDDTIENALRKDYLKVPPKEESESITERLRRQDNQQSEQDNVEDVGNVEGNENG